ncbi:MAG TPA: phosphoribosylamine--glycine ligase [Acidobacteriaceae bacterium]|jgi:phosphoribosylamine--glycine ligase|nr:phosphoribosylamine--glycine ligase [Acidobacteriaceae bacterium]
MKVLIIGGGGREHALARSIRKSPSVTEVVCAPGNGGMAALARCVPVNQKDLADLLRVVVDEQPGLTVVGPELPLSLGLVDELQRRKMRVLGPTKRAAMLESSKAFAKEFMQRHHIPTAHYAVCHAVTELHEALAHFQTPIVVKADGLAAGKGVIICNSKEEAYETASHMFSGKLLGSSETRVVLEEFLEGDEMSFLVLADGVHTLPLVAAQDHKRIGEGDTGLNTGGMGAYSTDGLIDANMRDWLIAHVAQPVIDDMAAEGAPFTGILYCGMMMTARGPMVLEFNARFGDPETQAVLPRLKTDLVEALEAAIDGKLDQMKLAWHKQPSVCVVAASEGYPGNYASGKKITGLEEAAALDGVEIFHSGTALLDNHLVTAGGRVLAVTALADTLRQACDSAYAALGKIHFDGMYYRRDIAHRALKKKG